MTCQPPRSNRLRTAPAPLGRLTPQHTRPRLFPWNFPWRSLTGVRPAAPHALLALQTLEDRVVPAVAFQFDYRYDSAGFFNDGARREALEDVGRQLGARLDTGLAAIAPGNGGSWEQIFENPSTGTQTRLSNGSVPADTMVVYVGGMAMDGEAGLGGPGGFSASGSRTWNNLIETRGAGSFVSWGGSLSFDTDTRWYFGADATAVTGVDFRSIAMHELTHVLGFGTSDQFSAMTEGGTFSGAAVTARAGSVRVSADGEHFAPGTTSDGQPVSMQPTMASGKRTLTTELDFAALQDLGWEVAAAGRAAEATRPTAPTPTFTATPVLVSEPTPEFAALTLDTGAAPAPAADRVTVLSGPGDGTVQIFTGEGVNLKPFGGSFQPFGDFGGPVRSAVGDVNGDGTADVVLGTGPGGGSRVRVLDGRDFADLSGEFSAFEPAFNGGVYLAAGDFDGDGRDEVVVSPDQGGGPRVRVLGLRDGQVVTHADFFGLADSTFRGGARVSAGDLNRDGVADLVVAAGFGGGPRVSLIDGTSVLAGGGRTLSGDFFAFDPSLRNGAYITLGDVDGDGFTDLVFGAGPGGGPRVLGVSGQRLLNAGPADALANPVANFFAGDPEQRGGVRVGLKDLNGDGQLELVTGSGSTGRVQTYNASAGMAPLNATIPFAADAADGIYVG